MVPVEAIAPKTATDSPRSRVHSSLGLPDGGEACSLQDPIMTDGDVIGSRLSAQSKDEIACEGVGITCKAARPACCPG